MTPNWDWHEEAFPKIASIHVMLVRYIWHMNRSAIMDSVWCAHQKLISREVHEQKTDQTGQWIISKGWLCVAFPSLMSAKRNCDLVAPRESTKEKTQPSPCVYQNAASNLLVPAYQLPIESAISKKNREVWNNLMIKCMSCHGNLL